MVAVHLMLVGCYDGNDKQLYGLSVQEFNIICVYLWTIYLNVETLASLVVKQGK
jgi:hypothetical protein